MACKRLATVALSVVACLLLMPWVVGWLRYDYGFLEAQVAIYGIVDDGTLYADGFTEHGFRSIEPGMSRQDVRERLGEPIVRPWHQGAYGDPSEWWYAFQRQAGRNAHRRCVVFGPDERVSHRIAEPNID